MAGVLYGNTNGSQVFAGSANQFVPPLGSQTDEFASIGPAGDPTIDTNVSSGGNASSVFGSGANPADVPPEAFGSGTPVYPASAGFEGSGENLGADVTELPALAGSEVPVDEFLSGDPPPVTTNDTMPEGIGPEDAGQAPFVFGSGDPPFPTTNDPQIPV